MMIDITPDKIITLSLVALSSLLIGFFLIIPMIEKIPFRLELSWRRGYEDLAAQLRADIFAEDYKISILRKALAIVGYILIVSAILLKFEYGRQFFGFSFLFLSMIILASINLNHSLFPDDLVFPTLWAGLLYNAYFSNNPTDYVYGAVLGYLVPFTIYQIIYLTSRKQVLGHGDFKMLSLLGAWFGASMLPTILLVYVVTIIITAIVAIRFRREVAMPTGLAYLSSALWVCLGFDLFSA